MKAELEEDEEMRRRSVRLADGRYLIFYTFAEGEEAQPAAGEGGADLPEPEAEPSAAEEQGV